MKTTTAPDGSFVHRNDAGKIHRDDGPAVRLVFPDRIEEQFWLDGKEIEACRQITPTASEAHNPAQK